MTLYWLKGGPRGGGSTPIVVDFFRMRQFLPELSGAEFREIVLASLPQLPAHGQKNPAASPAQNRGISRAK